MEYQMRLSDMSPDMLRELARDAERAFRGDPDLTSDGTIHDAELIMDRPGDRVYWALKFTTPEEPPRHFNVTIDPYKGIGAKVLVR
jgi:hypothetical protein